MLVLIVGIATGYFVYRQVQYNDTHRPQAVTFTVNLQNYGSDDTPIPLHVVGTGTLMANPSTRRSTSTPMARARES